MAEQQPMQQQIHQQYSNILLHQRGVIRKKIIVNAASITIMSSQIDIIIAGGNNRVKIQDSAGKICLQGHENSVDIQRSWLTCKIQGDRNQFTVSQSQFQLKSHQGEANLIPGILGLNPIPIRRRVINERLMNFRNAQRQKSQNVKKLLPHFLKSEYNSEPKECSICYDDIKKGDQVTSLFCFHLFHSVCILACLETAVKCPVCSFDLLKVISEELKNGNFVQSKGDLIMKESMEIEPK